MDMELTKFDENRLAFLEGLVNYFDISRQGDLRILKKLDKLASKLDYNSDVLKLAFNYAKERQPISFKYNKKTYRLTLSDIKFLNGAQVKKDGGILPILPILGLAAAAGATALAAKKHQELKELKAKSGGILPLLTLLPLIFGGVAAAGSIAGGAAGIAKAVNDKKAADEAAKREAEFRRQQLTNDVLFKQKLIDTLNSTSATPEQKAEAAKKLESHGKGLVLESANVGQGLVLESANVGSGVVADKLQEFGLAVGQAVDDGRTTLENTGSKVKGFFDNIGSQFRPAISKIFKKLGKDFDITEEKDGNGLYLKVRPKSGSGIFLKGQVNI